MRVALVNESKHVSAAQVSDIYAALHSQATEFGKAWGFVKPTFLARGTVNATTLLIVDTPDQAGALGYHSTDPRGKPYGRIFVNPVLDNGGTVLGDSGDPSLSVSAVASHEFLEWWLDPFCQLWADQGRRSVAYEACDPVENDAYIVRGVAVSNFVLPAWFNPDDSAGPWDYLGRLPGPFSMSKGGYLIQMADGKVSQVYARTPISPYKPGKAHAASRTFRRFQTKPDS